MPMNVRHKGPNLGKPMEIMKEPKYGHTSAHYFYNEHGVDSVISRGFSTVPLIPVGLNLAPSSARRHSSILANEGQDHGGTFVTSLCSIGADAIYLLYAGSSGIRHCGNLFNVRV